jgi:hypothetical protein
VVNLKTAQTVGLIGCGHLPNRLFAVAGKHTLARRGV